MVLIFGGGDKSEDLGEVAPLTCPNCHNEVFLHHVRSTKQFSLYFVPVASYGSNEYLVCPICRHGLAVPATAQSGVAAMRAETNLYRRGVRPAATYQQEVAAFWPKVGVSAAHLTSAGPQAPGVVAGPTSSSTMGSGAGGARPGAVDGSASSMSTADQLARLGDLHARGVITDEEFAAAKARVLGT